MKAKKKPVKRRKYKKRKLKPAPYSAFVEVLQPTAMRQAFVFRTYRDAFNFTTEMLVRGCVVRTTVYPEDILVPKKPMLSRRWRKKRV